LKLLKSLFDEDYTIKSIWLIGSRANETYNINSDWDILIFGSTNTVTNITNNCSYNIEGVDVIVVLPNDEFCKPFGEIYGASLSSWNWNEVDSSNAIYTGQENIDCETSDGGNW